MPQRSIIYWNTEEGKRRLFESECNEDFFALCNYFQPQLKPTYCGIATTVIFLNALRIPKGFVVESGLSVKKPLALGGGEMAYNAYSQLTFLNERTDKIKCRTLIEGNFDPECPEGGGFSPGMSLDDLVKKMKLHFLDVETVHMNEVTEESISLFRSHLQKHNLKPDCFMGVNFHSAPLGREGEGHFSPVVAYHRLSDSCLVMDVAGHKQPWFWVRIEDLCHAMHTKDGKQYRGYVLVTDKLRK